MEQALCLMIETRTPPTLGYWIGGAIALLLLAYLGYSLVKPEKF